MTSNLQQRIDERRAYREREKNRTQWTRDRFTAIAEAAQYAMTGFWCDECSRDVVAHACKIEQRMNTDEPRAFYAAACPKGHRVIRRITDKHNDPYYHKSLIMRRERAERADDMLQPHDPRFRIVYPEVWKKMEAEREAARETADNENLLHAR